jgi:hypothetical protein
MHEGDHSILDPEHDHNAHPHHHHKHGHDHSHAPDAARSSVAPRVVAMLVIAGAVAAFLIARFF